jgi:hypothetical protein
MRQKDLSPAVGLSPRNQTSSGMTGSDRRDIAERVRALIVDQSATGVSEMAERLSVDEQVLRRSIDETLPDPALDVLVAIVRDLGVDPTWLLTGEYAAATHERALESDEGGIVTVIKDLMRRDSPNRSVIAGNDLSPDFTPESQADGAQGLDRSARPDL